MRAERARQLIENFQPSLGIEKNVNYMLEMVGNIVSVPVYAFYIFDAKNSQYILKTVRYNDSDFGKARSSQQNKKESYQPAILVNPSAVPARAELDMVGEVPLFNIPLGGNGLIQIGPIKKISKSDVKALSSLSEWIQHLLPELVKAEVIQNQVDVVVASGKALQNISDAALNPRMTLEMMVGAISRALGALGGLYLEKDRSGRIGIPASFQLPNGVVKELSNDQACLNLIFDQLNHSQLAVTQDGEPMFSTLAGKFTGIRLKSFSNVQVGSSGALVLLYDNLPEQLEFGLNQLTRIAEELRELIHSQAPLQHLSKVYINILKQLARMMDNLNPYTVGYSDQMSRYSIVIAKQLGLPDDEIRDIALAAYLSNIGVLGLSNELYQKEGRFTEAEYEMMKLHSEVGASIVNVTTGNKRVASYIMHHHERIDGAGYPAGLRGPEIPVGAKIIAVVQTFLAKINGRKQRDPLPFDQALQMLKTAAGTQLDPAAVDGLISWFQSKRSDPKLTGRSLGACWDMCCTPSSICEHCPVYMNNEAGVNCWNVEGNLCGAHGKSCSTCFVRTEFASRREGAMTKEARI
jgi:HD-GYP domain-containing protein (c-di-GMP phosphodiesterase class II)